MCESGDVGLTCSASVFPICSGEDLCIPQRVSEASKRARRAAIQWKRRQARIGVLQ